MPPFSPRQVKAAGLAQYAKDPRVIGGLIGGGLGAGLTAYEASGRGPDLDKYRQRIDQKVEKMQQPGVRNFARAIDISTDRSLLTAGEAVRAHPVLSTLAAGTMGAITGATAGPELVQLLREAASSYRG